MPDMHEILEMFRGDNPADLGMPVYASRQWVMENSDLGNRIVLKSQDWADVPIPPDRPVKHYTHALYVVDCDHEDTCNCSEDESVGWAFVEFFSMDDVHPTNGRCSSYQEIKGFILTVTGN